MRDLASEVALLQSDEAAGLLRAALTGGQDEALTRLDAELVSWQYRPGAEVTAGYLVTYALPDGDAVDEHLFVTSARVDAPAVTVSREGLRFGVWRHPHDPHIPSMAAACDPHEVMRWLGVTGAEAPAAFDLTLLGYRPLRRAVLRATADEVVSYIKVLRPERADRLVRRQAMLAQAGLTPPMVAVPAPGVLVTPAAHGVPLSVALAGGAAQPPSGEEILGLLDRLPAQVCQLERRPAWADRLDFHAATARDRLPEEADRLRALTDRLERVLSTAPVGQVRPTHGDFYEANIVIDEAGRLSVVDLDSVGPGLREDDLACLLAHLAVLPSLSPEHYVGVESLLSSWTADFEGQVNPAALAARTAAVVLSLVAGAGAVQAARRLDLAEQWTERALAAA